MFTLSGAWWILLNSALPLLLGWLTPASNEVIGGQKYYLVHSPHKWLILVLTACWNGDIKQNMLGFLTRKQGADVPNFDSSRRHELAYRHFQKEHWNSSQYHHDKIRQQESPWNRHTQYTSQHISTISPRKRSIVHCIALYCKHI